MSENIITGNEERLLSVKDLVVEYTAGGEIVRAVNGVSFEIKKGETLGLVGETGAGKTTIAKSIIRILPDPPAKVKGGEIVLEGENLFELPEKNMRQVRGEKISMIFQDPMTALNPVMTVGDQISEAIKLHNADLSGKDADLRACKMLEKVGIPSSRFGEYPHQFSGGMKQRVVIAMALACNPQLILADEPTTALDVTIQAQIIKLIKDLQKEFGYTIVFITHDLGVVANIADRVAVLYAGQIVELGKVEEVFYDPRHPYTWALLSSLPQLAQRNTKLYSITGTPPSLYNQIVGDPFAPRNPYCLKLDTLREPPMFPVTETHFAKTWLLDPRAPKIEKPEIIQDIHEKLIRAFNI